jgi:hypothetical protein
MRVLLQCTRVCDGDDGKDTPNVDANTSEMDTFWSTIEAFLTSSSSTAAGESTGAGEAEEDGFAQLWGKAWSAEPDAGSSMVDLFTQMDDALKAEDILQQDIFA